jgi:hypothetical protein
MTLLPFLFLKNVQAGDDGGAEMRQPVNRAVEMLAHALAEKDALKCVCHGILLFTSFLN